MVGHGFRCCVQGMCAIGKWATLPTAVKHLQVPSDCKGGMEFHEDSIWLCVQALIPCLSLCVQLVGFDLLFACFPLRLCDSGTLSLRLVEVREKRLAEKKNAAMRAEHKRGIAAFAPQVKRAPQAAFVGCGVFVPAATARTLTRSGSQPAAKTSKHQPRQQRKAKLETVRICEQSAACGNDNTPPVSICAAGSYLPKTETNRYHS